jgi:hypothetical protein
MKPTLEQKLLYLRGFLLCDFYKKIIVQYRCIHIYLYIDNAIEEAYRTGGVTKRGGMVKRDGIIK